MQGITSSIKTSIYVLSHKLMGNLWAHMGAIGCTIKFSYIYVYHQPSCVQKTKRVLFVEEMGLDVLLFNWSTVLILAGM